MSPPQVIITIQLEGPVHIYSDTLHQGEQDRLIDWIANDHDLVELCNLATRIAAKRKATA
jgi:hypothetical protein